MKRLVTLWLSLVFVSPCIAQQGTITDHPRVQEALQLLELWVDAKQDYDDVPGMSMAVVYDQDIIWSKGFGLANREDQVPATPSTLYSICSISKLFTSVGVMQLRDAGRVRLDDPVTKGHVADLVSGTLAFMLPAFITQLMLRQVDPSMPSLMCHWALFMALFLWRTIARERRADLPRDQ